MAEREPLIPKHGGYRKLKSFQLAQLVYDVTANAGLVLLAVACPLLDRQVERLARDFEEEGGFSERLYRVGSQRR